MPALRPGLIELKTFTTYEKQLRNLQLQESRLSRRRDKEIAELRELQRTHGADDAKNARQALSPGRAGSLRSNANGFEFSNPIIDISQPYTNSANTASAASPGSAADVGRIANLIEAA